MRVKMCKALQARKSFPELLPNRQYKYDGRSTAVYITQ